MDQPEFAQNPDELFDVVTADGKLTGVTKRRADVHRDGDWHRAIHVWVYGVGESGPYLLMNQRGRHKDTWPGGLDATVGGHLGAGESVNDAFREIEEEIGITMKPDELQYIGTRPRAAEYSTPGVVDRELQEVFLCRDDRPLNDYRPNPAELEGLVCLSLQHAVRLFAGEVPSVPGQRLDAHDHLVRDVELAQDMLIPTKLDNYFLRVALAIERTLRGEHYIVV